MNKNIVFENDDTVGQSLLEHQTMLNNLIELGESKWIENKKIVDQALKDYEKFLKDYAIQEKLLNDADITIYELQENVLYLSNLVSKESERNQDGIN